jgi:hypothetical protein
MDAATGAEHIVGGDFAGALMKIKTNVGPTMSDPVPALRRVAGDALRAVAVYDRDGLELLYERDDVSQRETAIDRVHKELVLQELGREHLERLFGVGRWHCTMHRFDRATCVHYAEGESSGVFVSVDNGADVDPEALADARHSGEA